MSRNKQEEEIVLERYDYTINIKGFSGLCPYCKELTRIEYDQDGNTLSEEFCDCFLGINEENGIATYIKDRWK